MVRAIPSRMLYTLVVHLDASYVFCGCEPTIVYHRGLSSWYSTQRFGFACSPITDGGLHSGSITTACDSVYIVTDESRDLERASIYPDQSELVEWLESCADAHLEDDPKEFLSNFVEVPDLLFPSVIEEIKKNL